MSDNAAEPTCWIAVACAEHVRRGVAAGLCQVNHGKATPLRRLRPGDHIAYYSPTEAMGGGPPLQHFTALGIVRDAPIEQADLGGGFRPFRRPVD